MAVLREELQRRGADCGASAVAQTNHRFVDAAVLALGLAAVLFQFVGHFPVAVVYKWSGHYNLV
jgi:hypothetical protein